MYCISISHKVAPIYIREKFAFSIEEQQAFEKQVIEAGKADGCIVVSTCNRSEIYFTGSKDSVALMEETLAVYKGVPVGEVLKYYMVYEKQKAAEHLFNVASGMDSMVLGEDEILGQVKKAYQTASNVGAADQELNMLFQSAISSAKKVKNMTLLSKTSVSVGTLVAHEIFKFKKKESSSKKKVLIIGITGKMGTIIMKNILHKEDIHIIGTTRQHGYSISMGAKEVQVISYADRFRYLDEADIIISATASPHYTLTYEEAKAVIKTNKQRLFIDLAVPIDIDKAIGRLPGTQLFDIDHFEKLSKHNNEVKLKEIERGSLILQEEVEEVLKKVSFHAFLKEMPSYKQYFENKSFEQILYEMRDVADSREWTAILETVKKTVRQQADEHKMS